MSEYLNPEEKKEGDPNYFAVDHDRAADYLLNSGATNSSRTESEIPLGKSESIKYVGGYNEGFNNRTLADYQNSLFPEEYNDKAYGNYQKQIDRNNPETRLGDLEKTGQADPEFGGYDEVFADGNTVLDMGSGKAIGLMELADKHPDTKFIGIDKNYDKKSKIYKDKNGLQLSQGEWSNMDMIEDGTVDAIISKQGVGAWAMPMEGGAAEVSEEQANATIAEMDRVTKSGAIVRIDGFKESIDYMKDNFDSNKWDIKNDPQKPTLFVARKK